MTLIHLLGHLGRTSAERNGTATRRRSRGQSLTEFALIAPVMLALMGISIDAARFYFAWVNLEAATRDAAQYIASDPAHLTTGGYYDSTDTTNYCGASWTTCTTIPSNNAVTVLQNETGKTFTANATQTTCTSSKVWAILQPPDKTVAHGGSAANPVAQVKVTACEPFRTLISYPVISTNGTWILRTERTMSTIVGR